ncbi:unnamed protein product [Bursaphelenchus okinawaensis]|uniref:Uncharacterized protein n=1 Tax=Bursaphelenchus okinawaensis TaxID=465554 RepID=A0A811LKI0_9BILA|nr:unnamed protein product [Bursaphelenchus okinawaensis]CAG9125471.1 unnamed protein product [Bursaphelenchus okinawaensis]
MEELTRLWVETYNHSQLSRLTLLLLAFCTLVGVVIALFVFLLILIGISKGIRRKFSKHYREQNMRNEVAEEFTSFLSHPPKENTLYREDSWLKFVRNWFSYEDERSPEVPKRRVRKIMTPRTLLGRSAGLSAKKNALDNEGFDDIESGNLAMSAPELNSTLNYSSLGFERINLTAIDEE